ncbi:DUF3168 domain-containing protein [Roseovarius pelagicus]|uniref:DUF3168 domain-containing protein n=1 Tax=Roseovarius pelagicus TaxID=2980108 RepID=A0ABY6D6B2_9RHOB|nr:DUF3168 domain-containing protein [Roseovarius pelagicus]UXX81638.1 DUF3168 domain-containing protein [Roseovarius pelagicus]
MSYAASAALQAAIYGRLTSDAAIGALVGDAIYDALPAGPLPDTYVALGPEDVRDRSDASGGGAWHRFIISVVTEEAGFHAAKTLAAAIGDALVDASLVLDRGRLVGLHFHRARAKRESGGQTRRIDLTFRARVDDMDIV